MINDKLKVETQPSEDFDGEEIAVKLDGQLVFAATRYDGDLGYSSTFWQVDPNRSKEDYFRKLASFYEALKTGGFEDRGERGLPLGIMFDESTGGKFVKDYEPERVSLEALAGANPELLQHPRFKDFMLLRVDSPYAAFTMEDFSGDGWKPETGRIAVISHQDLSVPVAGLISETAKYSALAEQLQPILAEKVYTFKK